MRVLPALNRSIARLSAPGGYCSGALIAPDIVLTCAHSFRERPYAGARVRIDGSVFPVDSLHILAGTDVALARLPKRVDATPLELGPSPRLLARTLTLGYGGQARSVQARPGVYLGTPQLSPHKVLGRCRRLTALKGVEFFRFSNLISYRTAAKT